MNTAPSTGSLSSLPGQPRSGPNLRAPLILTLTSLAVAVALGVYSLILAGPHLADIFRELGSSGLHDPQALQAYIRNILSPGMLMVGFVAVLASLVFSMASLWLFIAIIIRLARR